LKDRDIEVIFDEILLKLNYFDIFNNKVVKNLNITIQREQLSKLDDCLSYLQSIINEIEKSHESHVITFTMKDYVEKLIFK